MKGFYLNSKEDRSKDEVPKDTFIMREPSFIEQVNNHIYFYAEIGRSQMLTLNRTIRDKANCLLNEARMENRENPSSIYLHINSYGGEIFAGFSAMDEILKCEVPLHTIIDGCCASAATFLSVVGTRRFINKHGYMLIHQLSSIAWGKYSELVDDMKNNERLMGEIKNIYREYTKIPKDTIGNILKHDLWWDAETCLSYGLVDEII